MFIPRVRTFFDPGARTIEVPAGIVCERSILMEKSGRKIVSVTAVFSRRLFFLHAQIDFMNRSDKQALKLLFTVTAFFLIVTGLNFLNAKDDLAAYWKVAAAAGAVLFIASIRVDNAGLPDSTGQPRKR